MPSESFRTVRWLRTLNLVLQAVLFLTLFGGLNYLASKHAWRFDLTRQRKFSLSPETLSYVRDLRRPVHIVVSLSEENDSPEVRGLVDEYVAATADLPGRITKEILDVYQNRRRAEELGLDQPDVLVLIAGQNRQAIPVNELYEIKNQQRVAFRGEQALTSAILDVSSEARQKIYFLVGHGELRPEDTDANRGLSTLRVQLEVRNFTVEAIDLAVTHRVPADASLLVAAGPQSRYTPAEQELLRQYLNTKAGRFLLFLNPRISASSLGLENLLLDDWGILVNDDVICDTGAENITENGDLFIWAFLPHPITNALINYKMKLRLGDTRSVMPDPGRSLGNGLNTVTVAATSTTAWGERDYTRPPFVFNRGIDTAPLRGMDPPDRLGVIVASERVRVRADLPFSVPGGRVVVFGNADFIANGRIENSSLLVALNAVNWSVDRDRQLSVPARPIERFHLSLSAGEFQRLRYALLLAVPGSTLLLGLLVYWTRRT
ncbi:MAG TPA: GldG family protein [Opitutaceae bacterium]|nr:GldG family protein [Opitutaceae bacterium]